MVARRLTYLQSEIDRFALPTAFGTTVLAGLLVVIRTSGNVEATLFCGASLAASVAFLVATLSRGLPWGGAAFFCAGYGWMLAGTATEAGVQGIRDGTVLLLTGSLLLASSSVRQSAAGWLVAITMGAAATSGWLLIAPDAFRANDQTWVVAGLAALFGTAMVAVPAIQLLVARPFRGLPISGPSLLWCGAGSSFILLALALTTNGAQRPLWFLPVLTISLMGLSGIVNTPLQVSKASILAGSFATWTALLATVVVAAAGLAVIMAIEESARSRGLAIVATAIMFAYVLGLSTVSLLRTSTIGSLERYAAVLLRQSRTDPLTGLANRRAIFDVLGIELQRSARFNHSLSIGLIDLDDFKTINDTWGHPVGDLVLQQVARRLENELRQIDIVGRYGGEEFLMLLPETGIEGAWIAADRVLRSIREMPTQTGHGPKSITVSIGLASFPEHGRTESDLLAAADAALYAAKHAGKDRVAVADRPY